jgi:hypothetical protein
MKCGYSLTYRIWHNPNASVIQCSELQHELQLTPRTYQDVDVQNGPYNSTSPYRLIWHDTESRSDRILIGIR